MSEMTGHATSPDLPVDSGIVSTAKEFSDTLTQELTDDEIKKGFEMTMQISEKWHRIFVEKAGGLQTPEDALKLMDQFEDELKYELATTLHILATVDPSPIFEGEPPIVEFVGALPSHSIAQYGFDHEKKTWEVQRATAKGEDYLDQKR